jgi:hypothetical protein
MANTDTPGISSELRATLADMHRKFGKGNVAEVSLRRHECRGDSLCGVVKSDRGDERFFKVEGGVVTYFSRKRKLKMAENTADTLDNVKEVVLYAWVGEDEFGSGEVGLKQAMCPAGCVPMVAVRPSKMDQTYIKDQLQQQANQYGKTIRFCKFVFAEEIMTLEPEEGRP